MLWRDLAFGFIRIIAPLGLAAFGELIGETAGLLNLSIEGAMVFGAFVGWYVVSQAGNILLGFAAAVTSGILAAVVFWLLVDILAIAQHVAGLGLGFALQGTALTIFRLLPAEKKAAVPFRGDEGVILAIVVAGLVALAFTVARAFAASRTGARWKMVGNDLRASDLLGIPIRVNRLLASIAAFATACGAGALLSILVARNFTLGIVSGRGWLALCLVILAQWRPLRLLPLLLLWAALELAGFHAQAAGAPISYELLLLFPYLTCLIVISIAARAAAPGSLLHTYRRNEDAA